MGQASLLNLRHHRGPATLQNLLSVPTDLNSTIRPQAKRCSRKCQRYPTPVAGRKLRSYLGLYYLATEPNGSQHIDTRKRGIRARVSCSFFTGASPFGTRRGGCRDVRISGTFQNISYRLRPQHLAVVDDSTPAGRTMGYGVVELEAGSIRSHFRRNVPRTGVSYVCSVSEVLCIAVHPVSDSIARA